MLMEICIYSKEKFHRWNKVILLQHLFECFRQNFGQKPKSPKTYPCAWAREPLYPFHFPYFPSSSEPHEIETQLTSISQKYHFVRVSTCDRARYPKSSECHLKTHDENPSIIYVRGESGKLSIIVNDRFVWMCDKHKHEILIRLVVNYLEFDFSYSSYYIKNLKMYYVKKFKISIFTSFSVLFE